MSNPLSNLSPQEKQNAADFFAGLQEKLSPKKDFALAKILLTIKESDAEIMATCFLTEHELKTLKALNN